MTEGTPTPSAIAAGGSVDRTLDSSRSEPPIAVRWPVDPLTVIRAMAAVGRTSDAWFALGAGFGLVAFGAVIAGDVVPAVLLALAALACLTGAGEIPRGWSSTRRPDGANTEAGAIIDREGVVLVEGGERRELPWSSISRVVDTGNALVTFVSRRTIVLGTASVPRDRLDAILDAAGQRGLIADPGRFRRALLTIGLLGAMLAYGWLIGTR